MYYYITKDKPYEGVLDGFIGLQKMKDSLHLPLFFICLSNGRLYWQQTRHSVHLNLELCQMLLCSPESPSQALLENLQKKALSGYPNLIRKSPQLSSVEAKEQKMDFDLHTFYTYLSS